jgi:putative addiction module component (TIGR02574 family)
LRATGRRTILTVMNKTLRDELMRLPADERVKLAHDLLDSVEEAPAVSGALLAEAKRRLAEHRADPNTAVPWEEARARLRSRLK